MQRDDEASDREERRKYGRASALGIELVITIVGGLLLGQYLDERFGTGSTLTVVGMVLGTIAGFHSLIKFVRVNDKSSRGDE
ncbi:MAG: AtpZ/AtpI family protein [Deltaproteobacteria bacterium]|nr:AtpZ/AtpI family protein [Deltaproteobacteria bacterium]